MITQAVRLLKRMFPTGEEGSREIPEHIAKQYIADPDFPRLISFPRTGSHWLRMLMELYFEKPSLVRAFYLFGASEFTCYHRHDEDLTLQCRNAIYLYRHPINTVYSLLSYYKEDTTNKERIIFWTSLYARHLAKWLFDETFTCRKTILTYERLTADLNAEFDKLCRHLNQQFNPARLTEISKKVTPEALKKKSRHDHKIINTTSEYRKRLRIFNEQKGRLVLNTLFEVDARLEKIF